MMAHNDLSSAEIVLIFSTFPDATQAREISLTLVREKLVACANLLPGATSLYVWQGEEQESAETLALFKTQRELYPAVEARLKSLHPYEVPEIVAVDLAAALPAYLRWVVDGTTTRQGN